MDHGRAQVLVSEALVGDGPVVIPTRSIDYMEIATKGHNPDGSAPITGMRVVLKSGKALWLKWDDNSIVGLTRMAARLSW